MVGFLNQETETRLAIINELVIMLHNKSQKDWTTQEHEIANILRKACQFLGDIRYNIVKDIK